MRLSYEERHRLGWLLSIPVVLIGLPIWAAHNLHMDLLGWVGLFIGMLWGFVRYRRSPIERRYDRYNDRYCPHGVPRSRECIDCNAEVAALDI